MFVSALGVQVHPLYPWLRLRLWLYAYAYGTKVIFRNRRKLVRVTELQPNIVQTVAFLRHTDTV